MATELVKQTLQPGDTVQKTWSCEYNNKDGYIVLSTKQLMFVEEKGFLRKTYSMIVAIPYDTIAEITVKDRYTLEIAESNDQKHNLSFDMAITSRVKQAIQELKAALTVTA
jgi:hypothetical protein